MNTAMFLQTMLEVLKYDSKFKDKKSVLLPILKSQNKQSASVGVRERWAFRPKIRKC